MGKQTITQNQPYGGRTLLLVFCVVIAMVFLVKITTGESLVQPKVDITPLETSSLTISTVVVTTECEDSETIDYSLVEMRIGGGQSPYDLTITNSKFQTVGPFKVTENDKPIQIKIYGGDYFTANVHSKDNKDWSAVISLPSEAEICQRIPTVTVPPSPTPLPIDMPPPTDTEVVFLSDTPMPTSVTSIDLTTMVATKKSESEKTLTPKPSQATNTLRPPSTNTSVPQATNTLRPPSTNTPVPQATLTPIPQYSNTPPPQPTLTPTPINPNPHECEDGLDNDGDGKIDYPADSECKKPSDQHEDKW